MIREALAAFCVLVFSSAAAQYSEISDGSKITLDLTGGNIVVDAFFFDVPAGTRNVLVQLSGGSATRDLDLYLRANEPFNEATGQDLLLDQADFWSISAFGDEFVNLQDFAHPNVDGRRWYVAVAALSGSPTTSTLQIEFLNSPPPTRNVIVDFENATNAPDCETEPWFDSAPYEPLGGNHAATLGQARRNALLKAAELVAGELTSRIPTRIRACWANLGPYHSGGITLGGGRPNALFANTPGLPPDTLYAQAVATRMAGTDICRVVGGRDCGDQDVIITFNSEAQGEFYYGFEPAGATTAGRDFISLAMHEITHGLGFLTLFGPTGNKPMLANELAVFDAFGRRLALLRDGLPVRMDDPSIKPNDRAEAFTSFDNLLWADDQASVQQANNLATFESGLIRMNAPPEFRTGSSLSHISGAYCDLMRPTLRLCSDESLRTLGLARRMLHGVGWADAPSKAPYLGLLLDRKRLGHGLDLRVGGLDSEGKDIYVITFYSFETKDGAPEWFQAVGRIEDGAFVPERNRDGNGIPRYLYDAMRDPPHAADADTFAQTALAYTAVPLSPACNDDTDRQSAESLASFQWAIGNHVGEWCVEPLIASTSLPPAERDFGGLWFAGKADQGWGLTIDNVDRGNGTLDLVLLAYVYASDGTPVWFFGFEEAYVPGTTLETTLFQRTGYPRFRAHGDVTDQEAGTLKLTLADPSAELASGLNRAAINVNFLGPEGGRWVREETPIQRLTLPR